MVARIQSRGRHIASKGLLLMGGLFVGFCTTEVFVRVADIDPGIHVIYRENFRLSENPRLQYELQSFSRDGRTQINSAGMRDNEYPLTKPAHHYRIVIAGDSVTYGLTVEQDHAFPQQLERMLNEPQRPSPRFEVLNLGVSGYNIDQIVERLRTLGLSYSPDLIIYAYSMNDPQSFSLELQGLTAMRREAAEKFRPRRALMRWISHSRVFLLAWRSLQDPWTRAVRPAHQSPDYLAVVAGRSVEYFEALHSGESWARVERGLLELAELVPTGEQGPRIVLATVPMYLGATEPYPLTDLHRRIVTAARRHDLTGLDLAPALMVNGGTTERRHFNDPFHPSAEGHRLIAAGLLRWLEDAGIVAADGHGVSAETDRGAEVWN